MKKGIGLVLPGIGVFLFSIFLPYIMMGSVEAAFDVGEAAVEDVENSVLSSSLESNHEEYLKLRNTYHLNSRTADLGDNGAGVTWNRETLDSIINNDYEGLWLEVLQDELDNNLKSWTEIMSIEECSSVMDPRFEVEEGSYIQGEVHFGHRVIKCNHTSSNLRKNISDEEIGFSISNNRYPRMILVARQIFEEFNSEAEQVQSRYESSSSSCGSRESALSSAESSAVSSGESDIESAYSSSVGSYWTDEGIVMEDHSKSISGLSGSDIVDTDDCDCPDEDEDGECDTLYQAEGYYEPSSISISINLLDDEKEVISDRGVHSMELKISYLYSFS